jgi:NAD(P)H dehydrogenase (quinone)
VFFFAKGETQMTIAITGATGQLGGLIIKDLVSRVNAQDVVALARNPEKASELGVAHRHFDYDQPETLAPALKGVETLLLISGSDIGRRVAQHTAVIDAAQAEGVGHIVYTSLLRAKTSTLSLAAEHAATELALESSGIDHTILRNGWYTENYMMGLAAAVEHKALIGAAGEGKISSATREDFAVAAATVLSNKQLQGSTYELAGDENYTLADLAAVLSKQVGEDIAYINMSKADYAAALAGAGVPEGLAGFLAHCDVEVSKGVLFDEGKQLSKLINRPTTSLESVVEATLA